MTNTIYIPKDKQYSKSILKVWEINDHSDISKETILPHGQIALVFNLSEEKHTIQLGKNKTTLQKCSIIGFNNEPIQIDFLSRKKLFGIHIRPSAFRQVFGYFAGEFTDKITDLTLLNSLYSEAWEN